MTLAILLSEGFDYNSSYEAAIFFGQDIRSARAYANARQSATTGTLPNQIHNTTSQKQSSTSQLRIRAIFDDRNNETLRSFSHKLCFELIGIPQETTIIELVHIMYSIHKTLTRKTKSPNLLFFLNVFVYRTFLLFSITGKQMAHTI